MKPHAIRFEEKAMKEIESAAQQRGFTTSSAFVRYAVEQELTGRKDDHTGAEERLVASVEQVRREVFRLARAQQALFAYLDTFAKTLLTCVPEPPADATPQAVARAQERHSRLLKSAGNSFGRRLKFGNEGPSCFGNNERGSRSAAQASITAISPGQPRPLPARRKKGRLARFFLKVSNPETSSRPQFP